MKKFLQSLVIAGVSLMVLASAGFAEGDKVNASAKSGTATAQGAGVAATNLAADLAEYARANGNASAMLVAAQILRSAPPVAVKRDKATEGEAGKGADKDAAPMLSRDSLLAEAADLAGEDVQLLAMVDAERQAQGTKGDITGPNDHDDRVQPETTDVYRIVFKGGVEAEVAVIGDGDNDLDLYVYDEHDNLIESDTDSTDKCYVSWTPKWTGEYTIKIKNLGTRVYSNYRLLTN